GTGLFGCAFVQRFLVPGNDVLFLSLIPQKVLAGRGNSCDAVDEIESADSVINLAGENVGGGRWTASRKQRILDSRLKATNALVAAMRRSPARQRTFLSASAVGFYGVRGEEILDESAESGPG